MHLDATQRRIREVLERCGDTSRCDGLMNLRSAKCTDHLDEEMYGYPPLRTDGKELLKRPARAAQSRSTSSCSASVIKR